MAIADTSGGTVRKALVANASMGTARQRLAAVAAGVAPSDTLRIDVRRVQGRDAWGRWRKRHPLSWHGPADAPWRRAGLPCPARFLSSSQRVPRVQAPDSATSAREKRETPPNVEGAASDGDAKG